MDWASNSDSYGVGELSPLGTLTDRDLNEQLKRYKRIIAKRYRVIPSDKCDEILPEGQLWISTKIDGQLWFLVARNGEAALCAYNGRVLRGILLVDELAAKLGTGNLVIAGELYAESKEGRPRVQHVAKVLGDGKRADELRFRAFDLVEEGETDGLSLPYAKRLERLQALLSDEHIITTEIVTRDEAPKLYREWVLSEEHEGLVARSEHGLTYKIKPSISLDLVVVAFGARINGETRELRELTVAALTEDGEYQIVGTVGGGFSDEARLTWHHKLEKLIVPSAFRMANSEGTLCHFVEPSIVIEVKCGDLLTHDGSDRPIRRMRVKRDGTGYAPVAEYHTAVMLHPRFERERDDKTVDLGSVGLEQITSRVSLDEPVATRTGSSTALPDAEIVERGVYVKETKGKKAVRKYVLIKTNKEDVADFTPFVLYTTDFSAGRAEPLKTGITVAGDREHADAQIESWKAENIKRGWNEV